jgi:mannose-6-phosphate isomerase-like protein (cupin superfamily)
MIGEINGQGSKRSGKSRGQENQTVTFGPGDFLLVPAGVPHRFRDFGESMMTWVMFYGPEGGEDA